MSRIDGVPGFVAQMGLVTTLQARLYEDTPLPTPTNATALTLDLTAMDGTSVYADNFITPPTPPGAPSRIVQAATGVYQFALGDPSRFPLTVGGPANQETATIRTLLATWNGIGTAGSAPGRKRQVIEVVSVQALTMVETFRLYIDKTGLRVNLDSNARVRLGYDDFTLLQYLFAGLSAINAYPPYPTFQSLDEWPMLFQWTLFEASLVAGLTAQSLYAVANDIPSWSDQGNAFVIDHFPKLAQVLQMLSAKLDANIPKMKFQHFVGGPSGKIEIGPNARLNALIQAAPNGALFRSLIFR